MGEARPAASDAHGSVQGLVNKNWVLGKRQIGVGDAECFLHRRDQPVPSFTAIVRSFLGANCAIVSSNSSRLTGFEMYPSIPARRQRSRSPSIAFAVRAMSGV